MMEIKRRSKHGRLTDEQQLLVDNNYQKMTPRKMSETLLVPLSRVYGYMNEKEYDVLLPGGEVRKNDRNAKEGMFNYNEKENWLV
jgi:hypothetical protein